MVTKGCETIISNYIVIVFYLFIFRSLESLKVHAHDRTCAHKPISSICMG